MVATSAAAGPSVPKKHKKGKSAAKASKTTAPAETAAPVPVAGALFGAAAVDPELDSIFAQSSAFAIAPVPIPVPPPKPSTPAAVSTSPSQLKRKHDQEEESTTTPSVPGARRPGKKPRPARDGSNSQDKGKSKQTPEKAATASKKAEVEDEESSSEDDDAIEASYAAKKSTAPVSTPKKATEETAEGSGSDNSEDDDLVHETLAKDGKSKRKKDQARKKTKWVPEGETRETKDKRTIFVGNLDVEVAKNKSALNKLRAHLLSFAPSASIESVRFRSIAFAQPTSALPIDEDSATADKEEARRQKREKERAAKWREQQDKDDKTPKPRGGLLRDQLEEEQADKQDQKVYLMPAEKRKVAFIKQDFHSEASSVNAYVVFAYNPPTRSVNVPPILDPFIAASQIIAKGNHSTFMDRTIRIDTVRPTLDAIVKAAAEEGKSTLPAKREAWTKGVDVKCSLFVGNLDYNTKEEDLRVFFEGLVKAERGERPLRTGEEATVEGTRWVTGVRLIRDRETQLGKGFGYVAFEDRECVDEILALPSEKVKFAKRSLRVQACKTLPPSLGGPATSLPKAKEKDAKKSGKPAAKAVKRAPPPVIKVPKGNPKLGEKLASLSKEERKAAKASDEDRLARRLAKKQALKAKAALAEKSTRVKLDVRSNRKDGGKKLKAKKSRVRSENAAKKMKGKRD